MASYCPHCGEPSSDGARFCMNCGRERLPAAAGPAVPARPPAPPAPSAPPAPRVPPPPAMPPVPPGPPAGPSSLGLFFSRAVRGDWPASARAACRPVGLLVVLAVLLAVPSYGEDDGEALGRGGRLRVALAAVLTAVGGRFQLHQSGSSPLDADADALFGSSGLGSSGGLGGGASSVSLVPLTVTFLWMGALWLGARALRRRGEGLDAAVRVSVLVTAAVLVLALFARAGAGDTDISSSPLRAAVFTLLISSAVTGAVLQRTRLAGSPGHPVVRAAVRACGTALRALAVLLALSAVAGVVLYATGDEVDGWGFLFVLAFLPNIAATVLGLGWGVPVEYDVSGRIGLLGSGGSQGSVGLSELRDEAGGWAVAGALGFGLLCVFVLGVLVARRSSGRRELPAAAGAFLSFYVLLVAVSGVSVQLNADLGVFSGSGTTEVGPSVGGAVLYGLLWVAAGVSAGPYLLRLAGPRPATGPRRDSDTPAGGTLPGRAVSADSWGPPGYVPTVSDAGPGDFTPPSQDVSPYSPTQSSAAFVPYDPLSGTRVLDDPAAVRRRRVLARAGILAAAAAIGGGATAGVLLLGNDDAGPAGEPRAVPTGPALPPVSPAASTPAPGLLPAPASSEPFAGLPTAPPTAPSFPPPRTAGTEAPPGGDPLPTGWVLRHDPAGFTVGVPEGWDRRQKGSQVYFEAPAGSDYLQIGVIKNAQVSSYGNFLALEEHAASLPGAGYQRLQLVANTFQGRPGAFWEFTHVAEPKKSSLRSHVLDQAFVDGNGTEFAILRGGRTQDWDPATDSVFSTAVHTFRAG